MALLGSGLAWLWGWAAIVQWYIAEDHTTPHVVAVFDWITTGSLTIFDGREVPLEIAASFQLDALSAVLVAFVTFVGFVVKMDSHFRGNDI